MATAACSLPHTYREYRYELKQPQKILAAAPGSLVFIVPGTADNLLEVRYLSR